MDLAKRKIIVSEIDNWRRNKLLPEHYCDFLLNLYLSEEVELPKKQMSAMQAKGSNNNWKVWISVMSGLCLLALITIYFNSFQIPMQIAVSSLVILAIYIIGVRLNEKIPPLSYFLLAFNSLLLLAAGWYILQHNGAGQPGILAYAFLCSFVWIATGVAAGKSAIHFAGWMLLLFVYGWVLQRYVTNYDWFGLQMSWVPLGIVLMWLGWLLHHTHKQVSHVLLIVGFIVWFVPDVFGLFFADITRVVMQISMISRIVIAAVFLYALRKKWTEWVA